MNIPKKRAAAMSVAVLAAFAALCCGCDRTVEYPEGLEGLPSYTTPANGEVKVYYDTSAPPEYETDVIYTESHTTAENVVTTVPTTQVSDEETTVTASADENDTALFIEETADIIETAETVGTVETAATPSQRETSFSPSISDVSNVHISQYNENTQGAYTRQSMTETTSPQSTVITLPVEEITLPPEVSETFQAVTTVSRVTTDIDDEWLPVVPAASADVTLHQELTDGRKSKYTGREIISHPMCYYSLDEKKKMLYDKLVSALLDHKSSIAFSLSEEVTFDDIFDCYQMIYNDEFRLFYITTTIEYVLDPSKQYITRVSFVYSYEKAQAEQMKQEIDTAADNILSKITPSMGDYEIVKLIHDSVIRDCTYLENTDKNTIYGCLVKKQALCQGYSKAFTYLCSLAGIEAGEVLGVANEEHMWNIVKMDGDYYHIDLTWDDPDKESYPDSVRYDYFCLTDERIRQLRTVTGSDFDLPAANGTKYQYFTYNGLVAGSVEEAESLILREIVKASEEKSSTVQFMCADSSVFEAVTDKLFSDRSDNVISLLDKANAQADNKFNTNTVHHNSNKNTRVVKIYIEYI